MSSKKYLTMLTLGSCFALLIGPAVSAECERDVAIYLDPSQSIDKRVEDLLSRMTLEEKIGQLNMPVLARRLIEKDREASLKTYHEEYPKELIQYVVDACKKFVEGTFEDEPEYLNLGPGGGFFALPNDLLDKSPRRQAKFFNKLQKIATQQTRLKIPLIQIESGEKKTVQFKLTPQHLSFLDQNLRPVVEPGIFDIMIGSSSEDIRLRGSVTIRD